MKTSCFRKVVRMMSTVRDAKEGEQRLQVSRRARLGSIALDAWYRRTGIGRFMFDGWFRCITNAPSVAQRRSSAKVAYEKLCLSVWVEVLLYADFCCT